MPVINFASGKEIKCFVSADLIHLNAIRTPQTTGRPELGEGYGREVCTDQPSIHAETVVRNKYFLIAADRDIVFRSRRYVLLTSVAGCVENIVLAGFVFNIHGRGINLLMLLSFGVSVGNEKVPPRVGMVVSKADNRSHGHDERYAENCRNHFDKFKT